MGRKPRIEYPGAVYHVYHRGNNRESILSRDQEKRFLLQQIKHAVDTLGLEVFAYVVMRNHYHMAIRVGDISLSTIMQRINANFSRYYNQQLDRSGHVFEGRYKAIPIENESYLLTVFRYIHQNPVRAGICAAVSEYRWSSDMEYRGQRAGFVNTEFFLDVFGSSRAMALQNYAVLMAEELELDSLEVLRSGSNPNDEIADNDDAGADHEDCEVREDNQVQEVASQTKEQRPTLDGILRSTGVSVLQLEEIKQGSRKRQLVQFKRAFAQAAVTQGYSLTEIGRAMSISSSAVSQIMK